MTSRDYTVQGEEGLSSLNHMSSLRARSTLPSSRQGLACGSAHIIVVDALGLLVEPYMAGA